MLVIYVFAILGMNLFAEVKQNYPMNDEIHFRDMIHSILTMIRVSTGENWHELMFSLSRRRHPLYQCIESPTW